MTHGRKERVAEHVVAGRTQAQDDDQTGHTDADEPPTTAGVLFRVVIHSLILFLTAQIYDFLRLPHP